MTPRLLLDLVIKPTLLWLAPQRWDGRDAWRMLIAIAMQETGLRHRDQLSRDGTAGQVGPATGWWQLELGGGFRGVERHVATRDVLLQARKALALPERDEQRWASICWGDAYACLLARALLWTHADPLASAAADGWQQYLELWRPGKPHPEAWAGAWSAALSAVSA